MKRKNFPTAIAILLAFALVFFGSPAFAQTTGGGTTPGGGGGGTGTPTAPSANTSGEIDLPIGALHDGAVVPEDTDNDDDEDDDDPVDEDDEPELYDEDLPTADESIIYVLDISGSMDWGTMSYTGLDGNPTTGTRLDRAKTELIRSIQALSENFFFNIFAYDCDIQRWSPARQRAVPAAKASGCGWVSGRRAMGATGTGPAVVAALADRDNHTVVLLSDGAPNCLGNDWGASIEDHRRMIRTGNLQQAIIHCFGIGAYGEFQTFLRNVAQDNAGRYYDVP